VRSSYHADLQASSQNIDWDSSRIQDSQGSFNPGKVF